jgi:hypothetical protein
MTTIGNFIGAVLRVHDAVEARRFFETELAELRSKHPEVTKPELVLRSNIGWCFGEGMPVHERQMWAEICGAEHPLGPEYTNREFTPDEILKAGMEMGRRKLREEYPSAWDVVLRERFED